MFVTIAAALTLTLPQAIDYALHHSSTIAQQQALVASAREQYVRARSGTLPNVVGQLQNQMQKSQNYSAYQIIGVPQASVFSQNSASLGTTYQFGGAQVTQALLAKQQFDQARANLTQSTAQLTDTVSGDFYALAGNAESVQLDLGDVQYQQALVAVAQAKERAGVAAGVDVLSAKAQAEKSLYTLASAQSAQDDARETLAQVIGAPLDTTFAIPPTVAEPPLPEQPLDSLIATALANRPEIAAALQGVEIARTNRRAADSDLLPTVQTFAQIGNQFSPTFAGESAQLGQAVARGNPGYWNIGLTTTLAVPFWDWGARRAAHRDLDEQIAAAQTALDAAKSSVELDVRRQYRNAKTALAQVASAQEESRYAQEAARVAKLQYQNGIVTLVDVQQQEQSALSAQADLYNARIAYAGAIIKLRVALGIYEPHAAVADM